MIGKRKNQGYVQCDQWLHVLDELNVGAFTVNLDRKLMGMNFSAQALMGLREKEVVGRDCREVFCGVPCVDRCLIRGDTPQAAADAEPTDDADPRHLVTRMATPVYGPDQVLAGCLTILQDHSPIADLINRIQYEKRSMKMILDHLDVGIFTVNRGGLITFYNTAAEKISGYDRKQVLGEPCSTIFEGERAKDVCLLKDSIADGSARSTGYGEMITIDGIAVPIRANYMALRSEKGHIVGGLTTFHDLTLVHQLNQAISDRYTYHDMIGRSPAMQRIFGMIPVVAKSDATILIEGATGTGKDLLAKVIHSAGNRCEKPMVKVNCAAIPDSLLESELFGYVRGAFTGADADKPGRFEMADGGVIFLDEIGDLPFALQAKLLRVIEDREFYPLGSRRTVKVDVRIVSATNRKMAGLVAEGLFREDLFYRLNVVNIEIPPLKKRRDDLPLLIPHVIRKLYATREKPPPAISEEVMDMLLNHDYPGNVRELENILEHALLICRGETVHVTHLPVYLKDRKPPRSDAAASSGASGAERERILSVLRQNNRHRGRTARALGMDRSTLWRKMKRLGIH